MNTKQGRHPHVRFRARARVHNPTLCVIRIKNFPQHTHFPKFTLGYKSELWGVGVLRALLLARFSLLYFTLAYFSPDPTFAGLESAVIATSSIRHPWDQNESPYSSRDTGPVPNVIYLGKTGGMNGNSYQRRTGRGVAQ